MFRRVASRACAIRPLTKRPSLRYFSTSTDTYVQNSTEWQKNYASTGYADLATPPSKKVAVLACMDARLNVEKVLGINLGEAHVIRNAGGVVDEGAVRSLIISSQLLGTREWILVHHTGCGMVTFTDAELKSKLEKETGKTAAVPAKFYAFPDAGESVRNSIAYLKSHPWIPSDVTINGFVYDVKTGALNKVG